MGWGDELSSASLIRPFVAVAALALIKSCARGHASAGFSTPNSLANAMLTLSVEQTWMWRMFGLAERGRLLMYEKTLSQIHEDAGNGAFFQKLALSPMLAWFCRTTGVQMQATLRGTIEAIPSAELPYIDGHLVRSIVAPASMDEMPHYQALAAINALVFVRVVEVGQPRLGQRARRLREGVLEFYEPAYTMVLEMLAAAESRRSAKPRVPSSDTAPADLALPMDTDADASAKPDAPLDTSEDQAHSTMTRTAPSFAAPRNALPYLTIVVIVSSAIMMGVLAELRHPRAVSNARTVPIFDPIISNFTSTSLYSFPL